MLCAFGSILFFQCCCVFIDPHLEIVGRVRKKDLERQPVLLQPFLGDFRILARPFALQQLPPHEDLYTQNSMKTSLKKLKKKSKAFSNAFCKTYDIPTLISVLGNLLKPHRQ